MTSSANNEQCAMRNPPGVGLPAPQNNPPPAKMSNEFAIRLGADLGAVRHELQIGAAITCLNDAERQFPIGDFCRDLYIGILGTTDFNTGKDNFCNSLRQRGRQSKSGYTLTYQVSSWCPCKWGVSDERCLFWLGQNLMADNYCSFLNMVIPSAGKRRICTSNGQCTGQACSAASSTYLNIHVANRHFTARDYLVLYPTRCWKAGDESGLTYHEARIGNTSRSKGYQIMVAAARQAGDTLLVYRCDECGDENERIGTKSLKNAWPYLKGSKFKCHNTECTCHT